MKTMAISMESRATVGLAITVASLRLSSFAVRLSFLARLLLTVVYSVLSGTSFRSALAQDSVRTLAGLAQFPGQSDGSGPVARFSAPAGLAVDPFGNVYMADSANHCIRKLDAMGQATTLIGKSGEAGATDGTVAAARLDSPSGLTWGADGTLYVADTGNHTVRRFRDGVLSTLSGVAGDPGPTNGLAKAARFNAPLGLVVTSANILFVADSGNHAIRRIAPDGTVNTLAGLNEDWGARDGLGPAARFNGPVGLALAADGALIVADSLNHALRRVTAAGMVSTFAGSLGHDGCLDGLGHEARFCKPAELHFDVHGNLYVIDAFNHVLRKVDAAGRVLTVAGLAGAEGANDGVNGAGRFFNPYGLVVRPDGSLVVSDAYNSTLREVLAPYTLGLRREAGHLVIHWESVVGRRYEVFARPNFDQPWHLATEPVTASSLTMTASPVEEVADHYFQVRRLAN